MACIERWAHRLLPYWSIGINVLLCLGLLAGGSSDRVEYGRKFAALILPASHITAPMSR